MFLYDKGWLLKYSFLWHFSSLPQTRSEKIRKHSLKCYSSETLETWQLEHPTLQLTFQLAEHHLSCLLPQHTETITSHCRLALQRKKDLSFATLKKKNHLNGSVLKCSKCLGSLCSYFFLTSFSLLALESYLPECKNSLLFPLTLGVSILEGLKYLHFVQFWHRCSELHFIHQMKFILV